MIKELSAITVLANKLCMFVLLFSLARILGVELYGVFSYHYAVVTGIASVVGECLSIALSRYAMVNPDKVDYKTSLGLMIVSATAASLLCVLVFFFFPAPVSIDPINIYYAMFGAFFLCFSCICNLTITGFMFSLDTSLQWVAALAAHGLIGLLIVVGIAKASGHVEIVMITMAICTLIAPVFGFLIIHREKISSDCGAQDLSFRRMIELLFASGAPAIAGSMLLGAPIHIACLMIFARASLNISEIGFFNIYFLFYILVTVLPSSLTSYAIVRLVGRGSGASRLYLLVGLLVSLALPILLILTQPYWLCFLGEELCKRSDLLLYAAAAGALGLITTIVTQIFHSRNMTKMVFTASCVYAMIYLSSTVILAVGGSMTALDLFKAFLLGLTAQLSVLSILGCYRVLR